MVYFFVPSIRMLRFFRYFFFHLFIHLIHSTYTFWFNMYVCMDLLAFLLACLFVLMFTFHYIFFCAFSFSFQIRPDTNEHSTYHNALVYSFSILNVAADIVSVAVYFWFLPLIKLIHLLLFFPSYVY